MFSRFCLTCLAIECYMREQMGSALRRFLTCFLACSVTQVRLLVA